MLDREVNGREVGTIVIEGRPYVLVVHPENCRSQKHWHEEPHADGSAVIDHAGHLIPHHHHDPACGSQPLNATLYIAPDWPVERRHEHAFGEAGECPCGAERERVPMTRSKTKREGRLYEYWMPADAEHPDGWSWERWSKHD